ncbi:cation-transporting P-type ATPase, partial [Candidatus Uhrbacteria bacterium]|nr:cation-transporting P-type ATPase [Candidatus Uhrbacteria bacterium]
EQVMEMSRASGDAYRTLERMTQHGLRVIGVATGSGSSLDTVSSWTFLGLVGLKDEPREQAKESVAWCQAQGIQVLMVTGDHPETAFAIGKELGIAHRHAEVVTGQELDMLTDTELTTRLLHARIFARINPLHKKRIVELLQRQGKRVAVTGDGVNDAPALQSADIGIAMGKSGTDVARAAADLILTDDHFATIVLAIQEARAVMARIRKVILYLFSTNAAEIVVVGMILVLGLPIPLLPVQILWLNILTDVSLVVALALEPHRESSRRHSRSILDGKSLIRMSLMAGVMALTTFLAYGFGLQKGQVAYLQSLTLLVLASAQWWNAWNCRSETTSVFRLPFFGNRLLLGMTLLTIALQLSAHYFAPLSRLLGTVPLTAGEWFAMLALSSLVLWVEEARKWYARRQSAILA